MDRSAAVGAVAFALLVATSGCLGLVTGGTVSFEATAPSVADATLEETGYELTANETSVLTRNVSVFGGERTVRVVNHLREYRKSISIPFFEDVQLARALLVTTPKAEVAGQAANPVGRLSERELLERFSGRTGEVGNLTHLNNRTVRSLGADRTVQKFTGTVERDGRDVDVAVHVASFEHEDDYVVFAAVHPRSLDGEQEDVDTLLRSIQH